MIIYLASLVSAICLCAVSGWSSPDIITQRIDSHIIIGDYSNACNEASQGLQRYPHSKDLWLGYIRACAKSGDEKAMMKAWKGYSDLFPEDRNNREILECMAWAVIEKGYASSSPLIRVIAMLGAFFSQDAKGVAIILQSLKDENSFIRGAAVKLSSHLHDTTLQEELVEMLHKEKVWGVRLELIDALGALKVTSSKKYLEKIIASEHCHAEEKAAAIQSVVALSENINKEQLSKLVNSDRAGFRMLACEFIAFFDQRDDVDLLLPLISDNHPTVRAKAFQTLGRLRIKSLKSIPVTTLAAKGVKDPDPVVAINAAWVLTIDSPQEGMNVFQKLLHHPIRETRYLAAAALAATGKYGLPLTKEAFKESSDVYVKMNLALGLIGQRNDLKAACDCLYAGLAQQKERWAWGEEDSFKVLRPSNIKHNDTIPNQPEAVNQLTRLEVLQMLAVVHYPHAQQAIKNFLQESNWGITGLASALLLTEGDDEAVVLVKNLLNDNDRKVRIQAALILALWGDGDEVVNLLQNAYHESDKEVKGQILEGIGRVGAGNSLTFLAERLQEPYQTLRIISAAALLECLYH